MIETSQLVKKIKISSLKMTYDAKASHIGSALSISEIIGTLYGSILRYDVNNVLWNDRDRFILSKGHACVAVYAALAEVGFFKKEDLNSYGKDFSVLMNHISHKVKGVEFSTGSLGHGLPFGVGKALGAKIGKNSWRTFVLMSDGELDEGSNWEALLFAAHHQLDNLIAIIDYNKLQSLDSVKRTLNLEPLSDKFRSFGWSVREVDGHNINSLKSNLEKTPWEYGKPSVLIAHTIKGKGVSFMENKIEWHYKSPSEYDLRLAIKEINNA